MTRPVSELLPALIAERGTVVSSGDCSAMEIDFARVHHRFFVDENGFGFVLRPKDWFINVVAACEPVIKEAKGKADFLHNSWNPDAHIEITLTVAELRAIHGAVKRT